MDTPSTTSVPAPLTPLGARTPHTHPGLYAVITGLSIIIIAGALWVFWPHTAVAPETQSSPSPTAAGTVEHRNDAYGFSISLPADWTDYSVLNQLWDGTDIASAKVTEQGPRIVLRHPLWSVAKPYEDLPILVFTHEQWDKVRNEELSLGAAPIGPSELGRNSKYILALPARYNYDYSEGWEEADTAVHTLGTFEPAASSTNGWTKFSSKNFTLSFLVPPGFVVDEEKDNIRIAKGDSVEVTAIGSDNAFFHLYRYSSGYWATKDRAMTYFSQLVNNETTTSVVIDSSTFPQHSGVTREGAYEAAGSGQATAAFLDQSWILMEEAPWGYVQDFDSLSIGKQILSTMRFSK